MLKILSFVALNYIVGTIVFQYSVLIVWYWIMSSNSITDCYHYPTICNILHVINI